jgi:hypothetical protein
MYPILNILLKQSYGGGFSKVYRHNINKISYVILGLGARISQWYSTGV